MNLKKSQSDWETFGKLDAKWAILTESDKKYNQWEDSEFFQTGRDCIEGFLKQLDKMGIAVGKGKAMDFGCGIGRLTKALGEHFEEATGVDISEPMISKANEIHADNVNLKFVLNTKNDLTCFEDDRFDLIFSFITLQHVPGAELIKNYLREFVRILKPDGIAYFQIPSVPDYTPLRSALLKARAKVFSCLTGMGLSAEFCFNTLHIAPYMHMTHIPSNEVVELVEDKAAVLHIENDGQTNTGYFIKKAN